MLSYGSNSRKRFTLRLMSMCLRKSTPRIRGKAPFDSLCNSFRWASFNLALHLCFSEDITKWCKNYIKTDSWFQKSHEEFGHLQTSSGKSKKLKFDGLLLSKKCIPSAKTYTEDLSNITFNYFCEYSPNSLYRF